MDDSCRRMLAESCYASGRQIAKQVGPHLMWVRKWLISIPTLCHVSLASSCPFCHHIGAGSINWHISQFLTTSLISVLATAESMRLTKYNILCMWMSLGLTTRLGTHLHSNIPLVGHSCHLVSKVAGLCWLSDHTLRLDLLRILALPVSMSDIKRVGGQVQTLCLPLKC